MAGVIVSLVVMGSALLFIDNRTSEPDDVSPKETSTPSLPAAESTSLTSPTATAALNFQQPHEQVIQRLVDDVINDGETESLEEIFAPGYVGHLPASETTWPGLTIDSYRELAILLHNAIPDIRVTPEIVISSGERLAMRATLRGTFEGEFYDFSPTGQPLSIVFTVIYRFDDTGKIAEEWIEYDTLAFAQQFGIAAESGD
jgi:predicted ester cyclase